MIAPVNISKNSRPATTDTMITVRDLDCDWSVSSRIRKTKHVKGTMFRLNEKKIPYLIPMLCPLIPPSIQL